MQKLQQTTERSKADSGSDKVRVGTPTVELAMEKPTVTQTDPPGLPTYNANKTNEATEVENPEKPKSVFNYGGFGQKAGGFGSNSNAAAKPVTNPPAPEEKKKSAFGSGFGGYSMGT